MAQRSSEERREPVAVSRQALVRVDGARYSVPSHWSGSQATAYVEVPDIRPGTDRPDPRTDARHTTAGGVPVLRAAGHGAGAGHPAAVSGGVDSRSDLQRAAAGERQMSELNDAVIEQHSTTLKLPALRREHSGSSARRAPTRGPTRDT